MPLIRKPVRTVITAMLPLLASTAMANDRPRVGIVYGIEKDAIEYHCDQGSPGEITCTFIQMRVRNKARPEDLQKELARLSELEKEFQRSKEQCQQIASTEMALKAGRAPPGSDSSVFDKEFAAMAPKAKQDLIDATTAIRKACQAPTPDNIGAMIKADHERKLRSCTVSAFSFEQTFRATTSGIWVHNQGPSGECGIIYVTSFEKEKTSIGLEFWNYKTRKIVTNKKGTALLIPCSGLDEQEYSYRWQSAETYRGCEYIGFGPL